MGFFDRAKSKTRSFLQQAEKHARTFVSKLPSNLKKGQQLLAEGANFAQQANNVVQGVNSAVQKNDIFGEKVKSKARQTSDFANLGLQKIDAYHKGGSQFLGDLAQKLPPV